MAVPINIWRSQLSHGVQMPGGGAKPWPSGARGKETGEGPPHQEPQLDPNLSNTYCKNNLHMRFVFIFAFVLEICLNNRFESSGELFGSILV